MKLQTLKKRKDFIKLNKFGKKYHSINFILQKYTNLYPEEVGLKFGFTATKKLGNAVIRNKAKRRMRELVYSLKDRFKEFGYDYVLIARKNILDKKSEDLKKDLNNTLKKIFPE